MIHYQEVKTALLGIFGSGGIRTHASEKTGALNQRLRPLGHATFLTTWTRFWIALELHCLILIQYYISWKYIRLVFVDLNSNFQLYFILVSHI